MHTCLFLLTLEQEAEPQYWVQHCWQQQFEVGQPEEALVVELKVEFQVVQVGCSTNHWYQNLSVDFAGAVQRLETVHWPEKRCCISKQEQNLSRKAEESEATSKKQNINERETHEQ